MIDRRYDCPDWMHIRQFVYLEKTCPRVLLKVIRPNARELHRTEKGEARGPGFRRPPVNSAGMISQRFPQQFKEGRKCALCGVATRRGEDVAYWGGGPSFGHALCRVAEWCAKQDAEQERRRHNAEHARRRRAR